MAPRIHRDWCWSSWVIRAVLELSFTNSRCFRFPPQGPWKVKHVSANSRYNVISFDSKELRVVFEVFDEEDTGSITADKVRCPAVFFSFFGWMKWRIIWLQGWYVFIVLHTKLFENWGFPISIYGFQVPKGVDCFPSFWSKCSSLQSVILNMISLCVHAGSPAANVPCFQIPRFRRSYWWSSQA